ncbi:protein STRUBBELIG-RECEPTOR FAMILY 2 isoform X2 [Spinacia oleracea]|uniref:Protein STRUBBELIG-RECEPTOR FAMILY 2 isoform X2 n=1 Tax=Spinacia oleracea TaxID=3562 RepID=A0ABM3RKM3_SPIOL|nr:protein STRUBBELIG-RECEPTOR FAMILY 2 isoform X2 [Spinacia oleracea]
MAMLLRCLSVFLLVVVSAVLYCEAKTDSLDVLALQDLYNALKRPKQLKGWTVGGGDPCEQSWTGVECSGSSVIHIKLHGLELEGYLGGQLFNLHSLKILDISSNRIEGVIPDGLPPNVTHLNLSGNKFLLSIPQTLSFLRNLRHLNLSLNNLSGPIGSVFKGLDNLKEMDLSYNKFSGDLPSSFASLTNLTRLFLQNNELTGSVVYLADLELIDLNIQDNHFSGIIPQHFQTIPNLWIGGNTFSRVGAYSPWSFPFDKVPNEQNITSPPIAESSAIEKDPSSGKHQHKKKGKALGIIALGVGGTAFIVTLLALAIAVHVKRTRTAEPENLNSSHHSSGRYEEVPQVLSANTPPVVFSRHTPAVRGSTKGKVPTNAKLYTVSELQLATNNFSEENFLGEGSLGSVYKAKFPDGKIFVVKNINLVSLSFHEEQQFLDLVHCTSRLQHPNIVRLVGYCVENGQHLLVYEYVRDLTLDKALHCKFFLPLTWDLRIQIAVGVAQALDYMHSLSPPTAHCNLKAANILLEDELKPRVSDSGLSILRPLTSNSVKVKASEMAISDSGYIAQEYGQTGIESIKTDVYAFGVLLLELLTGRRPFDSSRATEEQCLVKWASLRLHDYGSLEDMVDPILRRSISAKALSRCADVISLCVQPEKEFRPRMSEVAEALSKMLQKPGTDVVEGDAFEKSFRSTKTRFSELS